MKQRNLGRKGPLVSGISLGCMRMSAFYGPSDEKEALSTLHRALEIGINFWDTADMYGPHTNETLLGKVLKTRREEVFLATKFGIVMDPANPVVRGVNGAPDYIRMSVEGSLARLNADYIDLYYQHRIDPDIPVEESVGAMAELVQQGKVKYLGLSEASADTIRRAHQVHPITAVQSEYSLWSRDPESDGVLETCRELGIGFVPYSPLGRGFLTGAIHSPEQLAKDDFRLQTPRFTAEAFAQNQKLVEVVQKIATGKGITASQVALAWVLAQDPDLVPIPGTRRIKYLEENAAALDVELSGAERQTLHEAFSPDAVTGDRYTKEGMALVND